jgi:hypothetical protein
MAETIQTSDETAQDRPSYDDINTPVVIMWGFISAIVTLVTILTLSGVYNVWSASVVKKREGQFVNQPAREQVVKQMAILEGEDGSIPIAEAMSKVVEQYGESH